MLDISTLCAQMGDTYMPVAAVVTITTHTTTMTKKHLLADKIVVVSKGTIL